MIQTDGIDLRDVMLEAQAEATEAIRELLKEIALPQMMDAFRKAWMQMTDQQKKQFQAEKPEEYKALMEMFT